LFVLFGLWDFGLDRVLDALGEGDIFRFGCAFAWAFDRVGPFAVVGDARLYLV
jgi:hypothetical protein